MMKKYGYSRTEKHEVNEKILTMQQVGIDIHDIYIDEIGSTNMYQLVLRMLEAKDCIYFDSIKSMGENHGDILNVWQEIKAKDVDLKVLDFAFLDTTRKYECLKGKDIIEIGLQFYEYIYQAERKLAKEKQARGISLAKAKGVKFGRRKLEIPETFDEIYKRWLKKELSTRKASIILSVDHKTFKKWAMESQKREIVEGKNGID